MVKTKIIFLILPDVYLLDLAGPEQVFLEAIELGAALEIEYCSAAGPVASAASISLAGLKKFSSITISKGDYVFIPGARVSSILSSSSSQVKEIAAWLQRGYEAGAYICSVCTGAFFLARTGLLNGKKCTTHWKRTEELKQRYPLAQVTDNILFTEDQRVFTSAGVTAGIDLALHIISRIKGESFSFKVARELVVYVRRQGQEAQQSIFINYRNHMNAGIHAVQDYVQENIDKKISISQLAGVACTSSRNLTRLFKKETGITVNGFITLVRKELLGKLAAEQDFSRRQMAALCGLKSERQVIRLLKN